MKKLEIYINPDIANRYNEDTFREFLGDAVAALGMSELTEDNMMEIYWNMRGSNSRLSLNIIYMTIGMWEAAVSYHFHQSNMMGKK